MLTAEFHINGGMRHFFTTFLAGVEVGNSKGRFTRVYLLEERTRFHHGRTGTHHVVKQHNVVGR